MYMVAVLTSDGSGEEEEAAANKPTHNQCNYGSPCVTSGTPFTSTSAAGGQTLKLVKYKKNLKLFRNKGDWLCSSANHSLF